jgi:hypothetical protein
MVRIVDPVPIFIFGGLAIAVFCVTVGAGFAWGLPFGLMVFGVALLIGIFIFVANL